MKVGVNMSKELDEYKANNVALKEAFDKDTAIVAEQTEFYCILFIRNTSKQLC